MKKIANILLVVLTLITSITPIQAYNKYDHERDQKYVISEKRLTTKISVNSEVGDYVVNGTESLRMYYDGCSGQRFYECIGSFFMNVYDLNHYENRELVVQKSKQEFKLMDVEVPATYKDRPIKEKIKQYGNYFEIDFLQVTFYFILGYDIKINDVKETRKVFDFSKFKFVNKQVLVKKYYAAKVTTKEVIIGYERVIDKPAHKVKQNVPYFTEPKTIKYKALLQTETTGVGGFIYGTGEGLKATINFGGEVINAVRTGDETKITFIKNGQEYLAKVINNSSSSVDVYSAFITDSVNGLSTTVTVTYKFLTENPDQISELMGTISYAIAVGKFTDMGIAKLNGVLPYKINIDDDVIRLYSKYKDAITKPLLTYGDELVTMTKKYGDEVIKVIDAYDSDMVKSVVDNLDDFDNLDELAKTLDKVKDTTEAIGKPTFKPSQRIPVDPDTGFTKSNPRLGIEVHKEYKFFDEVKNVREKEFYIPGTRKRIDFIDFDKGIIYELKPNNPKSIAAGKIQAQGYIDELKKLIQYDSRFDRNWKYIIDTY